MKKIISFCWGYFLICLLLSGCTSTTLITSEPIGARLYIDGEYVGTTPYQHTDAKIIGMRTDVRLEMDGYYAYDRAFYRSEVPDGYAIVGGIFFTVPFLWTMKYKPLRTYYLEEIYEEPIGVHDSPIQGSLSEQLYELKKLFDDGLISLEEYESTKARILENIR